MLGPDHANPSKEVLSAAIFYAACSTYDRVGLSDLKRIREPEVANPKFEQMYSAPALENAPINGMLSKEIMRIEPSGPALRRSSSRHLH